MKTIVKEIVSAKNNIIHVEDLFRKVNEDFQLPEEEFNKLMIAVTEVVMNAIVHGNKQDEKKMVRLCVDYDSNRMRISICDEGNGFDAKQAPDPTLEENVLKSSGRGMYIVKSLVENIKYKNTGKGTEIIITIKKK